MAESLNSFKKLTLKKDPDLIIIDSDDDGDEDNNIICPSSIKEEKPYVRPIFSSGAFEISVNNTSVYLTNLDRLSATDPNYIAAISNYNNDNNLHYNNDSEIVTCIKNDDTARNTDIIELSDSDDDDRKKSSKLYNVPVMNCEDLLSDSEDDNDNNNQIHSNMPYNKTFDSNLSDSDMDIEPPLENTVQISSYQQDILVNKLELNSSVEKIVECDSKFPNYCNELFSSSKLIKTKSVCINEPISYKTDSTEKFTSELDPQISNRDNTSQIDNANPNNYRINEHRQIIDIPPKLEVKQKLVETATGHDIIKKGICTEINIPLNKLPYLPENTQRSNEVERKPVIFRSHTNNLNSKSYRRPYRCWLCPISFMRKCKLDYHIRQHANISDSDEESDSNTKNSESTKRKSVEIDMPVNTIETINSAIEVPTNKIDRIINTNETDVNTIENTIVNTIDTNYQNKLENLKCTICSKKYQFTRSLRWHMTMAHKKKPVEDKKNFTCTICSKKYSKEKILRWHVTKFHTNKTEFTKDDHLDTNVDDVPPERKCGICCKVFRSVKVLAIHIRHAHSIRQLQSIGIYCRVCIKRLY